MTIGKASTKTCVPSENEFGRFKTLLDRLLDVPHSKIKAELDAEKRQKQSEKKRAVVGRAYRDTD
jgi:hypothetical protein